MQRGIGSVIGIGIIAIGWVAGCGPESDLVDVPAGSSFVVSMTVPLSTGSSHTGDTFEARVDRPLELEGRDVIGVGAVVRGQVANVVTAAGGSTPSLTLEFKEFVDPTGTTHPLETHALVVAATPVAEPEPPAAGDAEEHAEATGTPGLTATVPILASGAGPVTVPSTDGEVRLAAGQEIRLELAATARLPI